MARINGVEKGGSVLARIAFFMTRKKVGRVIRPVRIHAPPSPPLTGHGPLESAQMKAGKVPVAMKTLGSIRIAMRIGCPF